MFWRRELVGEELFEAKRGYPSQGLLEGVHFSYVCTLIPQLIDVVASDFVLSGPPPEVNPAQPSGSRGGTLQVMQCKYAYLFRIILVVILFILLMILYFYVLSMSYFYF